MPLKNPPPLFVIVLLNTLLVAERPTVNDPHPCDALVQVPVL